MKEERFENLYNWMVKKNEIFEFMPKATKCWEIDKYKFIKLQQEMEKLANLTDIDLE